MLVSAAEEIKKAAGLYIETTSNKCWSLVMIEAISKKSFSPISVLDPGFKSSTYLSMPVGDPVMFSGRVETRSRLDLEPKSFF